MFDRLAEKLSSSHPQSSQDPLWQTCQISSLCFSSTQPRTLTFHTFHSGRAEVSEMDRTVSEVGSFHCTWNLIDSHTLFPACRKMTAQNTKAGQWDNGDVNHPTSIGLALGPSRAWRVPARASTCVACAWQSPRWKKSCRNSQQAKRTGSKLWSLWQTFGISLLPNLASQRQSTHSWKEMAWTHKSLKTSPILHIRPGN